MCIYIYICGHVYGYFSRLTQIPSLSIKDIEERDRWTLIVQSFPGRFQDLKALRLLEDARIA